MIIEVKCTSCGEETKENFQEHYIDEPCLPETEFQEVASIYCKMCGERVSWREIVKS